MKLCVRVSDTANFVCLTGSNIDSVIDTALRVYDEKIVRLSTNALVKVQQRALVRIRHTVTVHTVRDFRNAPCARHC